MLAFSSAIRFQLAYWLIAFFYWRVGLDAFRDFRRWGRFLVGWMILLFSFCCWENYALGLRGRGIEILLEKDENVKDFDFKGGVVEYSLLNVRGDRHGWVYSLFGIITYDLKPEFKILQSTLWNFLLVFEYQSYDISAGTYMELVASHFWKKLKICCKVLLLYVDSGRFNWHVLEAWICVLISFLFSCYLTTFVLLVNWHIVGWAVLNN